MTGWKSWYERMREQGVKNPQAPRLHRLESDLRYAEALASEAQARVDGIREEIRRVEGASDAS